ncbi:MAG: enoyl-CoA hydratase-related protein, partial [Megasphaera sp.]|nr:enoyl-CoA hydratase-related protein [Megasphaera sp.]
MKFNNIIYKTEEGIATIIINRPKALNALNPETVEELNTCIGFIEKSKDIQVVIITGSGNTSFVAGADIVSMSKMTPMDGRLFGKMAQDTFTRIENLPQPVIASVNGYALGGGCELACACDFRYASDTAKFGQPEVGLGVTPGFGGTQRLPRI